MKTAFISMSYRGNTINDTYNNIQKAREVAKKYWKLGYAVICPHTNSAMMDGIVPEEVWLEGYLTILTLCDVIVMGPNWRSSEGAISERDLAIELNKEIIYEDF